MKETFEILGNAIADVGYWAWWVGELPGSLQLEFDAVMLKNPPTKEGAPPSGKIALRFNDVKHISLMARETKDKIVDNWFQMLHEDKIEPFHVDYDAFALNDKEKALRIISEAVKMDTYFGENYRETQLNSRSIICFWAGNVGLLICSEDMEVYNHVGKIELADIPGLSNQWWEYWKLYWSKKGTPEALPNDFTCEVTIPVKD